MDSVLFVVDGDAVVCVISLESCLSMCVVVSSLCICMCSVDFSLFCVY